MRHLRICSCKFQSVLEFGLFGFFSNRVLSLYVGNVLYKVFRFHK